MPYFRIKTDWNSKRQKNEVVIFTLMKISLNMKATCKIQKMLIIYWKWWRLLSELRKKKSGLHAAKCTLHNLLL